MKMILLQPSIAFQLPRGRRRPSMYIQLFVTPSAWSTSSRRRHRYSVYNWKPCDPDGPSRYREQCGPIMDQRGPGLPSDTSSITGVLGSAGFTYFVSTCSCSYRTRRSRYLFPVYTPFYIWKYSSKCNFDL